MVTSPKHVIAGLVVAACAVIGASALPGCESRTPNGDTDADKLTTEVIDFSMDHLRGDDLRWRLTGARIEVMSTDEVRVGTPTVTIYEKGATVMVITGHSGTIDRNTHDLEITGSVRAVARDGVLYTAKLLWDDADGRLIGPEAVEIHRGRSVVRGARMDGQPDLKRVHLEDVRFRVLPEEAATDAYAKELDAR